MTQDSNGEFDKLQLSSCDIEYLKQINNLVMAGTHTFHEDSIESYTIVGLGANEPGGVKVQRSAQPASYEVIDNNNARMTFNNGGCIMQNVMRLDGEFLYETQETQSGSCSANLTAAFNANKNKESAFRYVVTSGVLNASSMKSDLPKLKKGAAYDELSRTLIDNGWTPTRKHDSKGCRAEDFRCKDHLEVDYCRDDSDKCRFTWAKDGQVVGICTTGDTDVVFDSYCNN